MSKGDKSPVSPKIFEETLHNVKHAVPLDGITIFTRNMFTGGVAASIAVTVMAPIERIKLILQVQNSMSPKSGRVPYAGLTDALIRIPQEQGFISLWRGNMASVVRGFPYQALNFAFRDIYRDYLSRDYDKKYQFRARFLGNLLSGGMAGCSSMAILYPLDYARTRMAMDFGKTHKTREIRNMRSIIRETYRKDGIIGLYRGFWFSLIGVFIYRATYFGLFDTAKDAAPEDLRQTLPFAFVTAEVAATFSGFIAYPFDTVRRSLMMQSGKEKPEKSYYGSIDCVQKIYEQKGMKGFYHGAFANVIRGTGGAIMLVLYDEMQQHLWRTHSSHHAPCIPEKKPWMNLGFLEERAKEIPVVCTTQPCEPCPVREFAERINLICDH